MSGEDAPRWTVSVYRIVCDGPPGPEGGRLVEVEDENGRSIAGQWTQDARGYWVLELRRKEPEVIRTLCDALESAIEGWEDGAAYKGDFLAKKHRDGEGITAARKLLADVRARYEAQE